MLILSAPDRLLPFLWCTPTVVQLMRHPMGTYYECAIATAIPMRGVAQQEEAQQPPHHTAQTSHRNAMLNL